MPFNIGPGELIIVLIIALIFIGPGKLPSVGSALGKSISEFRKAATDIKESTSLDTPAYAPAAAATLTGFVPAAPPVSVGPVTLVASVAPALVAVAAQENASENQPG